MHYMKFLGLGIMVFAIGATVLFGQGNQEAAISHARESKLPTRKIGTKRLLLLKEPRNWSSATRPIWLRLCNSAPVFT